MDTPKYLINLTPVGAAPRDEARELSIPQEASALLLALWAADFNLPRTTREQCLKLGSALAAAPRADTDRMEQLEEALRPFAKWADMSRWVGCHDATPLDSGFSPTVANLRYARDLLAARAPGRAE